MNVLITGGAGFIGARFARHCVQRGDTVTVVDALTYAGDVRRVSEVSERIRFEVLDIRDQRFNELVQERSPQVLVHFAAETHVTRSEGSYGLFHSVNVDGTESVIRASKAGDVQLLIHISTDEVYGPCSGAPFSEQDKEPGAGLATSPYAISKALADDLARHAASELPIVVVRPTNCFGPHQHPEKAVARWLVRALRGEKLPVWGTGTQIRDWMFVDDLCMALFTLISKGSAGNVYNVAPENNEVTNLHVAREIARIAGLPDDSVYLTAYDRPEHDARYAVDASKLKSLGWKPTTGLRAGLATTFKWYRDDPGWWKPLVAEAEAIYADDQELTP